MSSYLNFYFFPCFNIIYILNKSVIVEKCDITFTHKKYYKKIQINNIKNHCDTIDKLNNYKCDYIHFGPYNNLQDLFISLVDCYFKDNYQLPIKINLKTHYLDGSDVIYHDFHKYIIESKNKILTILK